MTDNTTNRFDQNAASWDAKEYRTRMAANVAASIRSEVNLNRKMDLLDFGCGTGLVSLSMAGEVASLTGLDNSTGMLDVFMEKAVAMNLNNVKSLNLNLSDGDALSGSYDLIMSSMTLHHVKEVTAVIGVLYGALKPGGCLCIADLDFEGGLFHSDNTDVHHFGFNRDDIMGHFQAAGFTQVRTKTAALMPRIGEDGIEREFSLFLATGMKS